MTNEDKNLLLKDICARLPYGVKGVHREQVHIITNMNGDSLYPCINVDGYDAWFPVETFKPYLRPMLSMTKEERDEYNEYLFYGAPIGLMANTESAYELLDFLNSHHFDYRELIEKGLALEAPEEMYK